MFRVIVLLSLAAISALAEHQPLVRGVDSVKLTVSNLEQSIDFYSSVLSFEKVSVREEQGEAYEHLTGILGAHSRTARMRLGEEYIELTEYLAPRGIPAPRDQHSNDKWFQHIAIVVSDMDRAYDRLARFRVPKVSASPQTLPAWNKNASGIRAFYFRDPDGHPLEIIYFPPDKGLAKWHAPKGKLFLGIDHTAIVISNTEKSLAFYRDLLGLRVAGESENSGIEQERLNAVVGAHLHITSLRGTSGPGVEFLEYLAPTNGRPYPVDEKPNDLVHWQTTFRKAEFLGKSAPNIAEVLQQSRTPFVSSGLAEAIRADGTRGKSIIVRDPDGHAVEIVD
jgi:catechol 2,3-dioxygenase-like lactoylglutathione lyase family enzyme